MKKQAQIIYTQEFISMVKFAFANSMFLGTGNPNSNILIIGKEAAISMSDNEEQYNREIRNNAGDWIKNYENNIQVSDVSSWFDAENRSYNPLYPYKNQLNTVEMRDKNNRIIRGQGGTSRTCFNYQKLMEVLYNGGIKSDKINFHAYSFSSELNEITGKYSKLVPRKDRLESIEKRKNLFAKPFFRQFPVTIVAVGHYVRDFEINLEKMFDVTYQKELSLKHSDGLGKDFINVHFGNNGERKRILVHTNQLSMISSELIHRLGKLCGEFLHENLKEN